MIEVWCVVGNKEKKGARNPRETIDFSFGVERERNRRMHRHFNEAATSVVWLRLWILT